METIRGIAFAGVCLFATAAQSQDIVKQCIPPAGKTALIFSNTYNVLRTRLPVQKAGAISDYLEGLTTGIGMHALPCAERLSACIRSTEPTQRVAMVEKAANEEPELWNEDASQARFIWNGFAIPCLRGAVPLKN
jgi:hypothetical protein